ncbi:MAG: N-acetylgalactosamine-6-sulfatase, partial [Verrucomicrobiota bacterium]|nr:N-acetylgalactosamine-6-sulfatase [Verrucomicrobiota bacterium]
MFFSRTTNLAKAGAFALVVAFCLVTLGQATGATAKRPNILFVMADDLGWMDLACQGNKLV